MTGQAIGRARDHVADVVGDLVAALRRGGVVYGRALLSAPWGMAFGSRSIATIYVVIAGSCVLAPDDGPALHLAQGDVALLPSGAGHVVSDAPGRPAPTVRELFGADLAELSATDLVIEGAGPETVLVCGAYLLEPAPQHPFLASLPDVVRVTAGQMRGASLAAAVHLLTTEVDHAGRGTPAVVASLLDLLFTYTLRSWFLSQPDQLAGWARALHDPAVGPALALLHDDPGKPWTVDALAHAVGVPRARFSRRFAATTGHTPMEYLGRWRMTVAARLLREGPAPLRQIARKVGYDSEFAFARAFKRVVGDAPGRYRAMHRREDGTS
ncbi:AraC family transcriptional regulator [Amycolatopsis orientalis]|uniref:AraC family transcriptional regulator n=1 Tax=Amycolatopsis orientalis TaxID=31958 RepID=UPI0003A2A3C5|nr:AraC family transcriptional regulator [Amycolatopsis orientalis]